MKAPSNAASLLGEAAKRTKGSGIAPLDIYVGTWPDLIAFEAFVIECRALGMLVWKKDKYAAHNDNSIVVVFACEGL